MACGEPQWWYDLIMQPKAYNRFFGDLIDNFAGAPLLDEANRLDVSVSCLGEVNSCGEVTLGAPYTCTLPFELEEDTPEEAYERAMKGI